MRHLDLLDYSDHRYKISAESLNDSAKPEKHSIIQVLSIHFLDFLMIYMTSAMINLSFKLFVQGYMVTKGLKKAYLAGGDTHFLITLPVVMVGYFFFSYFFNHGQTYAMHVFKKRIPMPAQDLKTSLKWSLISSSILWTGGLSLFYFRLKEMIRNHDYLYSDFMAHKDFVAFDLVSQAQESKVTDLDWQKAA